jgi:PAS domain-containing protein
VPGLVVSSDALANPSTAPIWLAATSEPPARLVAISVSPTAPRDTLEAIFGLAANRRLQEQAATERLLLVDLQRSEERFKSLVKNASDGFVVLGEGGLVRYESPAGGDVAASPEAGTLSARGPGVLPIVESGDQDRRFQGPHGPAS